MRSAGQRHHRKSCYHVRVLSGSEHGEFQHVSAVQYRIPARSAEAAIHKVVKQERIHHGARHVVVDYAHEDDGTPCKGRWVGG